MKNRADFMEERER